MAGKGRPRKTKEIEFFRSHFDYWYRVKWEEKGGKKTPFIKAIQEKDPGQIMCSYDYRYVDRWRKGTYKAVPPDPVVKAIAEVLDIQVSDLVPVTHDDLYIYKSERANEIGKEQNKKAEESFGLSLSFVAGLRDLVDFDAFFPLYTPLEYELAEGAECQDLVLTELMKEGKVDSDQSHEVIFRYRRRDAADHAPVYESGSSLFSINQDGHEKFLTEYDMKYLASLQDRIQQFIEEEFENQRNRLQAAAAEASTECLLQVGDGVTRVAALTARKLQQIDNSGMYTNEEWEHEKEKGKDRKSKLIQWK